MPSIELYEQLIAKVKRSQRHLGDLQNACDRFDESNPYRVDLERDLQTGEIVYYLRSFKAVPQEIALIAGDVLNNLRSALDHTAWHFAQRCTPIPHKRDVYFPIRDTASEYNSPEFRKKMDYWGHKAIDVLDSIKPYKEGNDALWKLRELSNLDKHRLLVPVAHVHSARTETLAESEKSRERWAKEHPNEVFIRSDIRQIVASDTPTRLLKAGDELLRIASELNEKPKVLIEVALAEAGIAEGEPLVPALHEIHVAVLKIISRLTDVL